MKVVFIQDVPNVAKAGEVKEVADGYARNFLIPKKLALVATPQALSQTEIEKEKRAKALENAELMALAQQIEGKEITIKAKSGAKGKLYGSITHTDIATELSKTSGLEIDKRKIELEEPIHQLGSYEVIIKLAGDIVPKIKVNVIEEEAPKEERPPKKEEKTKAEEKAPEKEEKPAKAKKAEKEKKTAKKEGKPPKEKGKG